MKISEKRRLKRIAIMEAALEVWAENEYANTSLSLLSNRLGMTKPALYRYFDSKDDLLNVIASYCSELMEEQINELLPRLGNASPEEKIRIAVSSLGDMIARQEKYIYFESFETARKGIQRWSQSPYTKLQAALELPTPVFRILMIYTHCFRYRQENSDFIQRRSVRETNELITDLFFNGFGGKEFVLPEGYTDIMKEPGVDDFRQKLSRGSIMGAISEVIREKGFSGVTLEGIASKAGLSKSTLYNYFKNKDEMLTETSNGFVKEYIDFHAELLSRRSSFEDKLTAHLCLQGFIFPQKPQAVLILRQLISRDVMSRMERPLQKPGFLIFLEEGIRQDKLRDCLSPVEYQIIFSLLMITEQVFNSSDSRDKYDLLDWLKLLACGCGNMVRQYEKGPLALK